MKITEKINVYNCDNMEFMKNIPNNYYDLAIVDPPYGIGEDGAKNHSRDKATKATKYTAKNWDSSAPNIEYFNELKRVSKNQIIFGANHFIENISNANSSCWIVWNKLNTGDFADCELAYTSFNTSVRKFDFMWNGMLQGDMKNKEIRIHPTQKPVALYKWILDKYAKENDKILDTHLGSMSIAIACHDYGFYLDGCELDKEYFDKGVQRVLNHVSQQKLF
jgi:site-specific DNA-methyltransferase (adenine-specific)